MVPISVQVADLSSRKDVADAGNGINPFQFDFFFFFQPHQYILYFQEFVSSFLLYKEMQVIP